MWLQAHTPRWGTWRTGAAKAQKGNDALADSAPPQAPRPHATRKGSSRPGSRPAHLQPLRIHGSHRAGSRPPGGALAAAQQKSQGLPAPQPRPKSRSRSGTRREGRGGAGPRCHWLPAAGGGLSTPGFVRRRCCGGGGAARTRRKGCGWERGSDMMVRKAKGFKKWERPEEDSGWAGPSIWNEGIKEIGEEVGKRALFPITGYKERHHFLPFCVEAGFRNAAVWRTDHHREKALTFTCSSCITAARWR